MFEMMTFWSYYELKVNEVNKLRKSHFLWILKSIKAKVIKIVQQNLKVKTENPNPLNNLNRIITYRKKDYQLFCHRTLLKLYSCSVLYMHYCMNIADSFELFYACIIVDIYVSHRQLIGSLLDWFYTFKLNDQIITPTLTIQKSYIVLTRMFTKLS